MNKILLVIIAIFLIACNETDISSKKQLNAPLVPQQQIVNLEPGTKFAIGQSIYVPVYSHIYYDNKRIFDLAVTLSIRNTDLANSAIATAADYYDSHGKLVRRYLNHPVQIPPLGSLDFFVNATDTAGGIGANFIVEWMAQEKISEPIAEAVMIGTQSTQGISFVSTGKVIKTKQNFQYSSSKLD